MKRLIVLCAIVLMLLMILVPVGCQQNAPDVVEIIAIFPAESGSPPPTGAWAYDRKPDPHPDRIQRVFNLGDRMFLGLRISEQLETDITFSRYTFFNRDTGEEIEAGLPSDLGPFEPGQITLSAFQNPWMVPADPDNYELRIYLDDKVVASARFEISTKVTRQPVVMVKSQLTGGRSGQSSGFIFRSDGSIITFLADVSEIEQLEVVLSNGYPLEASVSRTDDAASLACIKVEKNNLIPFTLAGNNEVAELKTGTHLIAAGYSGGEYREIETEVLDTKHDLPLPEGTELRVMKLSAGGEPGMAGGPVVNDAGHVVGVMLAVDPKTGESFMVTVNHVAGVNSDNTSLPEGAVTEAEAKRAAMNQIVRLSEAGRGWQGAEVGTPVIYYAADGSMSAYEFPVLKGGGEAGYILVSARKEWMPVLEYSDGSAPSKLLPGIIRYAIEKGLAGESDAADARLIYWGALSYSMQMGEKMKEDGTVIHLPTARIMPMPRMNPLQMDKDEARAAWEKLSVQDTGSVSPER
jgi:S1-C subfamily serine protease